MHDVLPALLMCPDCQGTLRWDYRERAGGRIEAAEATCYRCGATYPVRDGIGVFLPSDLPRNDLWEQVDSALTRHLCDHPDVEARLLDAPLESLNPADQQFRALVLDERGEIARARQAAEAAAQGLCTAEMRACGERVIGYLVERLAGDRGDGEPIVDLASGRCSLVERVAQRLERPIVATDVSPRVLRRDRRLLEHLGLYHRVSLLAMDARRTPFKTSAVRTMTTFLGLGNIEEPGDVAGELRRVVGRGGTLWSISQVPAADLDESETRDLLSRHGALARFPDAGWHIEVGTSCRARAEPTPRGVIIDADVDGFPTRPTTIEWCVVTAR